MARETIVQGDAPTPERERDAALRPRLLREVIGQRKVVERLGIVLNACKKLKEAVPHIIFDGPPGLGKTTFANVLPNEMGTPLQMTSGPALSKPGDLLPFLTNAEEGSFLFIDEIHRMPRVVEEFIYPAMEDFRIDIVLGEGITRRYYREYATCREKDYAPVYEKAHHKLSSAWIQRLGGTYIGGPLWIGDAIARAVPRPVYMKVAFKIGANFSTSRKVLERVNGFDRQFDGLSGEDGEFFWRCFNAGVVPRSVVLRAIGYHLWHREQWQRVGEQRDRSLGIERATREGKRTRAVHGLVDERSGSPSVASAP